MITNITYAENELNTVVCCILNCLPSCSIITFTGALGVGKTTLIRALLRMLGVHDVISSPTFTYVNTYSLPSGMQVYHFDLYRIKSLDDFIGAGFQEYLYQPNTLVLIEWPALIEPLLTHNVCSISLEYAELDKRTVIITSENN